MRRPGSKFPATSVYVSEEPESLRKGRRVLRLRASERPRWGGAQPLLTRNDLRLPALTCNDLRLPALTCPVLAVIL